MTWAVAFSVLTKNETSESLLYLITVIHNKNQSSPKNNKTTGKFIVTNSKATFFGSSWKQGRQAGFNSWE